VDCPDRGKLSADMYRCDRTLGRRARLAYLRTMMSAMTQTPEHGAGVELVGFSSIGAWRWQVVYSDDANNQGATSACGVEQFTIANH
jgi:hypothetical protein